MALSNKRTVEGLFESLRVCITRMREDTGSSEVTLSLTLILGQGGDLLGLLFGAECGRSPHYYDYTQGLSLRSSDMGCHRLCNYFTCAARLWITRYGGLQIVATVA